MKTFIVIAAVVLGVAAATETVLPLPPPGPDGMIELPGKSRAGFGWTVSSFTSHFNHALDYCASTGRKLLAIEDATEQRDISRLLLTYGLAKKLWTSGVEYQAGVPVWDSTLRSMVYTNFGNARSDFTLCLAIDNVSTSATRFKWLYTGCATELYFICEN